MKISILQPSWLWRLFHRNAWCVPVDRRAHRPLTDEERRHADSVLEKQSDWRVRQAWQRRGIVDANGYVRPELLTESNVVPFTRRVS